MTGGSVPSESISVVHPTAKCRVSLGVGRSEVVVWVSTIEAHGSDADTMMASPGTIVWTTDTWLASDLIPPAARNLSPDQLDRTEPVGPAEIDLATVLDPGTGPPPEVLMLALLESLGQSRPGLEDLQREAMRVAIDLLDPKA